MGGVIAVSYTHLARPVERLQGGAALLVGFKQIKLTFRTQQKPVSGLRGLLLHGLQQMPPVALEGAAVRIFDVAEDVYKRQLL